MKKLISSAIIILPLLLLAILLVSGAIMGLLTHIYVEKVEFADNEAIIIVMEDEKEPPKYNLSEEINIFPLEATNRNLVYTGYDENVVEVNEEGIVTPVFYGETYITVQSKENKAATASRKIIITDTSVHALKFNNCPTDLYEGESYKLSVSIYPQEAENKAVQWASSDNSILQVSSNGTITALGNGQAIITAKSLDETNGIVQSSATINCHAKLKSILFNHTTIETSLTETHFPKITTNPENCDVNYEYISSNKEIAKVEETGKIVFEQAGLVTVTVKVSDFNGYMIEDKMNFISTLGYFAGSLFDTHEIRFDDCVGINTLPISIIPTPNGAYRKIESVECGIDSTIAPGEGQTDVIYYDEESKTFKINGQLPEFNNQLYVLVNATMYDFETNTTKISSDYFYIYKIEIIERAKVYDGEQELNADSENSIEFNNIGENVNLTINNPDNVIVKIEGNAHVGVTREGNIITLTSKLVCEEKDNISIKLSVGTKIYNLKIKVSAKAEFLNVTCSDIPISANETYKTLLDSLTLEVEKGRVDQQKIASPINYQINESSWEEISGSKIIIDTRTTYKLTFECDGIIISFNLEKIYLADFSIEPSFTRTGGDLQTLEKVESVAENKNLQIKLPSNIQDNLTLKLNFDTTNLLGGLGDTKTNSDFAKLFKVDLNGGEGWRVDYSAVDKEIIITFSGNEFNQTISLVHGELNISLQIVKVNIQSITFVNDSMSFDSGKDKDIHKGYQQVRVFAKHSYYNGEVVDYFKIPLKVLSNIISGTKASLDTITWNFYRYVGNDNKGILTSQMGDTVLIGENTYKIVQYNGEYVLQDVNGQIVSGQNGKNNGGYIWVDIYTEQAQDYARIYFGNFGGLTESDVYNDYFGNFDELEDWTKIAKPTDDKKGKIIVEPSENAFAFLKTVAGDGVVGGQNCYFNFNILNDTADKKLVNVFDADGYYENDNLVLHTDLYGPGEVEKNDINSNLFLDRVVTDKSRENKLSKTTIFGNGYHINLMARNTYLLENTDPSKYGYHNGAAFYGIYNLVLMGSNPTSEIKRANQAMVFRIGNAYYCDIQYLAKINSFYDDAVGDGNRENIGSFSNIKNSVIRYASWTCYQLSFPGDQVFFENVVFVESNSAITMENKTNMSCYFNGFYDALCYNTLSKICTDKGYSEGFAYDAVNKTFDKYAEWFGKINDGLSDVMKAMRYRYVNPLLFDATGAPSNKPYFWNGEKYEEQGGDLTVVFRLLGFWPAWTYDKTVDFDGGEMTGGGYYTSRDMSKLFDNPEEIRLLCEYKGLDEKGNLIKNSDHVLWHIHKVYRNDLNINDNDHIKNLKESLIVTKDASENGQRTGFQWKDGSGVDSNGNPYEPGAMPASIQALNKYLECAIIPRKEVA